MFWSGEVCYNMVSDFTITVWVCYVFFMVGRPPLQSKGAQKVFHYMISNPDIMVRCWRARLYQFASGSFFQEVGQDLKLWLEHPDEDAAVEVREEYHRKRKGILRKLENKHGLFPILGDLLFRFMELKKTPFPFALRSKQDFLQLPSWKRAMIHISALRVILEKPANRQWRKYNVNDYKWNIRTFDRYVDNALEIASSSPLFQKLPELPPSSLTPPTKSKKRKSSSLSSTPISSDAEPPKTHFVVSLVTSSEEESDDGAVFESED